MRCDDLRLALDDDGLDSRVWGDIISFDAIVRCDDLRLALDEEGRCDVGLEPVWCEDLDPRSAV
jgi:hypothetical protein